MKIGLSLSLCVKDVIEDKMNILDVAIIVSNTCARTDDEWRTMLDSYRHTYWRKNPVKAMRAVAFLRAMKLIVQPRLYGFEHPGLENGLGIWKESE